MTIENFRLIIEPVNIIPKNKFPFTEKELIASIDPDFNYPDLLPTITDKEWGEE